MNIGLVLRDAWRITWQGWPLWLLCLLLFLVFIPAFIIAGAFGGLAGLLMVPIPGPQPAWLIQLRDTPAWVWGVIAGVALVLLVATSAVAWMLQVAAMRGAALAAERGTIPLGEALALGRQRALSIVKLSTTFGLLIAALGLLPPLALLLLQGRFRFGLALLQSAQAVLAPVNMVLGIALLLVMMSVALEDLKPRAAFRRAWGVFRSGWWGFVLVVGLTALPGLLLVVLIVVPLALAIPAFIIAPQVGGLLLLGGCAVMAPVGLVILLFTAVFSIVLYTLVYRAAAQLAG